MKIGGYYRIGHVAVACKGVTVITSKYREHALKLLEHVSSLGKRDRLLSGQEFSDVTGLEVTRGCQTFTPRN